MENEKLPERNRGPGRDDSRDLLSGRNGPGGRTIHARVNPIGRDTGGAKKAIAGLDYDARQGKHTKRMDELELEGGRDREEMAAALLATEVANSRSNGKVALDLEIELPAASTADQRRQIAEWIAEFFEGKGCPTHWAIHSHNSAKAYQPHLHMTTTARPVEQAESGQWIGTAPGWKGHPGVPAAINGPEEMRHFRRQIVAGGIKAITGLDWHGGRLAETGIDRPAKVRLPMGVYKRIGANQAVGMPAESNILIDSGLYEEVRMFRAEWVADQKRQREERQRQAAEARLKKAQDRLAALGTPVIPEAEAKRREQAAHEKGVVVGQSAVPASPPAPRPLSERQALYVRDTHAHLAIELPDLTTAEGQSIAWATVRAAKQAAELTKNEFKAEIAKTKAATDEEMPLIIELDRKNAPPSWTPRRRHVPNLAAAAALVEDFIAANHLIAEKDFEGAAIFDKNGKRVTSAGLDGMVIDWSVEGGREVSPVMPSWLITEREYRRLEVTCQRSGQPIPPLVSKADNDRAKIWLEGVAAQKTVSDPLLNTLTGENRKLNKELRKLRVAKTEVEVKPQPFAPESRPQNDKGHIR